MVKLTPKGGCREQEEGAVSGRKESPAPITRAVERRERVVVVVLVVVALRPRSTPPADPRTAHGHRTDRRTDAQTNGIHPRRAPPPHLAPRDNIGRGAPALPIPII